MNWPFARQPDPELSSAWDEAFWPPKKEWYDFIYLTMDKLGRRHELYDLENARDFVARLTQEQFMLVAVMSMAGQVTNGGFSQALYNSSGEFAEECIQGFRLFGMQRFAEIFDEAWDLFGIRPIPRDQNERIDRLELLADLDEEGANSPDFLEHAMSVFQGTEERWDELEKEFFALLRDGKHGGGWQAGFYRPMAEWIYHHRDRFFMIL